MGPVKNHRWIYACAKQLLERVLHAYGLEEELNYTIIRPFNFIGPRI
jgi:UDP-apiose/xylose synthase